MSDQGEIPAESGEPELERHRKGESRASLSTPWGDGSQSMRFTNIASVVGREAADGLADFVDRRSQVHETYIREQAKNKRIGLILAFTLILAAAALVTFAPEGRQTISYWIGAALLVFAAGCSGFGRVWGKTKNISFGADQDRRGLGE
jgi:hypothetical protein